jgi:hypothetical protein
MPKESIAMAADPSDYDISAAELNATLGTDRHPIVIDVRRAHAFQASPSLIAGSAYRVPEEIERWQAAQDVEAMSEKLHAIPFDTPGVDFSPHGEGCSFDAMIERFDLTDPTLERIATVVRGADHHGSISPGNRPGSMPSRSVSAISIRTITPCSPLA